MGESPIFELGSLFKKLPICACYTVSNSMLIEFLTLQINVT